MKHRRLRRIRFSLALATVLSLAPLVAKAERQSSSLVAVTTLRDRTATIGNDRILGTCRVTDGRLQAFAIEDRVAGTRITPGAAVFTVGIRNGVVIEAHKMRVVAGPRVEKLVAVPNASRLAERLPGQAIAVDLEDSGKRLRAEWRAVLRDGSSYLRLELVVRALSGEIPVEQVTLVNAAADEARVVGSVKGSPVVAGSAFFAVEHPLSISTAEGNVIRCRLDRALPLTAGQRLTVSSVIGVTDPGQLRRQFLLYIERERAHPYRPFLHYNSWYDIGYFSKFDEAGALSVIEAYGQELVVKRGATLDSFLFDDGWDDPATLWHFHSGFPRGFTPLRDATSRYGSAPGVWLSPWGGYGPPKAARLEAGRKQGFETNEGGFVLSGPTYYRRFRDVCLDMIRTYNVNQFKIDGTGNADSVFAGSEFGSDFEAAIHLIGELRGARPDLYVNLTTGTYPSPFWLFYADSTWRGGDDHEFAGVGTDRQRWVTYRDADTYAGVVQQGPLYPLNSLMLHGLIFATHAKGLNADPGGDFPAEIRSYFGTGTQLQEMYVTPSLLSDTNWDTLAESAKWARANADVLVDTHWVGGDPAKLEVYGWASWASRKGIIVLRNPADRPQEISIDVERVFELPAGAPRVFAARSPWQKDAGSPAVELRAGQPRIFRLQPFEVLTLDAAPEVAR